MEENIVETNPKPNPLTTVTPLSKFIALILFISLPFLGFYLGTRYQNAVAVPVLTSIANTSSVNRPNNSFAELNQSQSFLTSTPSALRSGWIIHKFLDFSLELPKEWMAETEKGSNGYFRFQNYTDADLNNLKTPSAFANNTKGYLFMEIYGEDYPGTVKDYISKRRENDLNIPGENPKYEDKEITVSSVSAVKSRELTGIIHGDGPGTSFVIHVKHPNKAIVYSLVFHNPFKNYESFANQILSTFKFLN